MDENRIIDFHVHFFPDKISIKAVQSLSEAAGLKPFGNGSISSLLSYMKEDGIFYSVNQPVATKAGQVISINRQIVEQNKSNNNITSFGAMHPDFYKTGNIKEEINFLKENVIKGIKLHPEYQEFYPDDEKMTEIYEACRDFGLIIMFHSGKDLRIRGYSWYSPKAG